MKPEMLQEGRAVVLFDIGYLYHMTKSVMRSKIDYGKLMTYLTEDLGLLIVRAMAFMLDTRKKNAPDDKGFGSFIAKLKGEGIDVKLYLPRAHWNTTTDDLKTDCIVALTTEAMTLAQRADTVVIAAGNADLAYPINRLNAIGVRTVVLGYRNGTGRELIDAAHIFIELSQQPGILMEAG